MDDNEKYVCVCVCVCVCVQEGGFGKPQTPNVLIANKSTTRILIMHLENTP